MQWPATFNDKNRKEENEILDGARRTEKQQDTALPLLSRINLMTARATRCEQRLTSLLGSLSAPYKYTQQLQWPVLKCEPSLTERDITAILQYLGGGTMTTWKFCPTLDLGRTLKLQSKKAMRSLVTTPIFRLSPNSAEGLPHSCSCSCCREQMLLLFCVYPFFLELPSKAFTELLSCSSYADRNVKPRLQP